MDSDRPNFRSEVHKEKIEEELRANRPLSFLHLRGGCKGDVLRPGTKDSCCSTFLPARHGKKTQLENYKSDWREDSLDV